MVVYGLGYEDWSKKRKFEKKFPRQEFDEFEQKTHSYVLAVKPKKLPDGITITSLNEQVRRTYLLAHLDEADDPTVIRCQDCRSMIDVTPYSPDDSLFCDNCSRVMGQDDDPDHGICDGCGYYTKLVKQEKAEAGENQGSVTTSRICHRCRVSDAIWGFVGAMGSALGIGLLNILAIVFANRYFPVLILFAVLALLFGTFKLVMVIVYSLARKAAGETQLENATNALRKGKTDEAMGIIKSMDSDMTKNPGILLNLSRGLMNSGDFDKADQFADSLIKSFPNFTSGYQEKVSALAGLQRDEEEVEEVAEDGLEVAARNCVRSLRRQKLLVGME